MVERKVRGLWGKAQAWGTVSSEEERYKACRRTKGWPRNTSMLVGSIVAEIEGYRGGQRDRGRLKGTEVLRRGFEQHTDVLSETLTHPLEMSEMEERTKRLL